MTSFITPPQTINIYHTFLVKSPHRKNTIALILTRRSNSKNRTQYQEEF